jgi:predicted nucleic acid-binding protein
MNCFFDTSALAKLFQEEDGTAFVENIVNDPNNKIWVLDLARIEFLSSLYRRYRQKDISEDELDVAICAFNEQILEFNQEFLGPAVLYEAEQLMKVHGKTHGLRSLDALQLGACSMLRTTDWFFVCSDKKLCGIARLCKMNVLNPLESGDQGPVYQ